jgi:hypothetical protein
MNVSAPLSATIHQLFFLHKQQTELKLDACVSVLGAVDVNRMCIQERSAAPTAVC